MPICREPASWHTTKKRSAKFRANYELRITNPIIVNELDIIEQLTIAAEQAGANLAPTYQEYMPLAFAIANSCGEAGRSFFHRLCSLSAKYRQADADKLYNHALQSGRGGNSLGTVFHLAQLAGVRFDKKLANLQNLQGLSHPHTRIRA